jgi:hypothetical protein
LVIVSLGVLAFAGIGIKARHFDNQTSPSFDLYRLQYEMSKFLRQIEFRGFLRDATRDESRPNLYNDFEPHDNFLTGLWAYARYALPVRCDGVAKINCYGCPSTATRCDEPCLNIASLWISIPETLPTTIDACLKQQEFMVEFAHRGLTNPSTGIRIWADSNPANIPLQRRRK